MPIYLTAQDEKNLTEFKKLTNEKTDGGALKLAVEQYPKLAAELEEQKGRAVHYRKLFYDLKQAIENKLGYDKRLEDTLKRTDKEAVYKHDPKKKVNDDHDDDYDEDQDDDDY